MGTSTWVRAHAALTREPEINLAGLEPSRRYQFRVIAENALGFSEPSEASVATVPHFLKELKDIVAVEHEKVTHANYS
jgi:titin